MGGEALKLGQCLYGLADRRIALGFDVGDASALEKVVDGSAGVGVGEATSGQDSIGADGVVARAERCVRPDQNLARVFETRQESEWLTRLHFQVLRRVLVDKSDGLVHARGQHNATGAALALEAGAHKALARLRQSRDPVRQQPCYRFGNLAAGRDQQGRGVRAVLLLDQQIAGQQFGIGALVGQGDRFAWASGQANIDGPIEQAFGRRDIAAARAGDLMHTRDGPRAVGQGRDSLRAAHAIDFMHAAQVSRDQRGRVYRTVGRGRRADHDARHARDPGRNSKHIHYRREGTLATWYVEADRSDRRNLLTRDHARSNLSKPLFMRHLFFVEPAHIRNGPLQCASYWLLKPGVRFLDLFATYAQPARLKRNAVKFLCKFQQRLVAPFAHSRDNRAHTFDQLANLDLSAAQQAPALLRVQGGQIIKVDHSLFYIKKSRFCRNSYTNPFLRICSISYSAGARGVTPASEQARPMVVKPMISPATISAGSSEEAGSGIPGPAQAIDGRVWRSRAGWPRGVLP